MASQTYNDFSEWKQIPLKSIILNFESEYHEFKNLTSESTFHFRNIKRTDDCGGTRNVGLKYSGRFLIAETNFETMMPALNAISTQIPDRVSLDFESVTEQENGGRMAFLIDVTQANISDKSFSWEIMVKDNNPILIITIEGSSTLDALSASPSIFFQYW